MMTHEQERWSEALTELGQHGANAPAHVALRIGELALKGDQAGIDRWKAIAHRIDQMTKGSVQ